MKIKIPRIKVIDVTDIIHTTDHKDYTSVLFVNEFYQLIIQDNKLTTLGFIMMYEILIKSRNPIVISH